jgi:small subunit ribosomal protein S16
MRLTRVGSTKNPIYRIVVVDQRARRDGRAIEMVGQYNPRTEPSTIEIDADKAKAWLAKGAQPSRTVKKLLAIKGIGK